MSIRFRTATKSAACDAMSLHRAIAALNPRLCSAAQRSPVAHVQTTAPDAVGVAVSVSMPRSFWEAANDRIDEVMTKTRVAGRSPACA